MIATTSAVGKQKKNKKDSAKEHTKMSESFATQHIECALCLKQAEHIYIVRGHVQRVLLAVCLALEGHEIDEQLKKFMDAKDQSKLFICIDELIRTARILRALYEPETVGYRLIEAVVEQYTDRRVHPNSMKTAIDFYIANFTQDKLRVRMRAKQTFTAHLDESEYSFYKELKIRDENFDQCLFCGSVIPLEECKYMQNPSTKYTFAVFASPICTQTSSENQAVLIYKMDKITVCRKHISEMAAKMKHFMEDKLHREKLTTPYLELSRKMTEWESLVEHLHALNEFITKYHPPEKREPQVCIICKKQAKDVYYDHMFHVSAHRDCMCETTIKILSLLGNPNPIDVENLPDEQLTPAFDKMVSAFPFIRQRKQANKTVSTAEMKLLLIVLLARYRLQQRSQKELPSSSGPSEKKDVPLETEGSLLSLLPKKGPRTPPEPSTSQRDSHNSKEEVKPPVQSAPKTPSAATSRASSETSNSAKSLTSEPKAAHKASSSTSESPLLENLSFIGSTLPLAMATKAKGSLKQSTTGGPAHSVTSVPSSSLSTPTEPRSSLSAPPASHPKTGQSTSPYEKPKSAPLSIPQSESYPVPYRAPEEFEHTGPLTFQFTGSSSSSASAPQSAATPLFSPSAAKVFPRDVKREHRDNKHAAAAAVARHQSQDRNVQRNQRIDNDANRRRSTTSLLHVDILPPPPVAPLLPPIAAASPGIVQQVVYQQVRPSSADLLDPEYRKSLPCLMDIDTSKPDYMFPPGFIPPPAPPSPSKLAISTPPSGPASAPNPTLPSPKQYQSSSISEQQRRFSQQGHPSAKHGSGTALDHGIQPKRTKKDGPVDGFTAAMLGLQKTFGSGRTSQPAPMTCLPPPPTPPVLPPPPVPPILPPPPKAPKISLEEYRLKNNLLQAPLPESELAFDSRKTTIVPTPPDVLKLLQASYAHGKNTGGNQK